MHMLKRGLVKNRVQKGGPEKGRRMVRWSASLAKYSKVSKAPWSSIRVETNRHGQCYSYMCALAERGPTAMDSRAQVHKQADRDVEKKEKKLA